MITERTLKKWRREALEHVENDAESLIMDTVDEALDSAIKAELSERILRMTQELLDQHLLKRK